MTWAYPPSTVTPRRDRVLTVDDVSPSAGFTRTVFAAKEANADALTGFPFGHSAPQCVNAATIHGQERGAASNPGRCRDGGRIGYDKSRRLPANANLTGPAQTSGVPLREARWFGDFDCLYVSWHLCPLLCSS